MAELDAVHFVLCAQKHFIQWPWIILVWQNTQGQFGFPPCAHEAQISSLDSRFPGNIFEWHHQYFLLLRTSHLWRRRRWRQLFYYHFLPVLAEVLKLSTTPQSPQWGGQAKHWTAQQTLTWTEGGADRLDAGPGPLCKFDWPIAMRTRQKWK